MQSYPTLYTLASDLSRSGLPTLRLEYDGTGESFGDDLDPDRVERWIESVVRGAEALRSVPGVDRICAVGLRMGASLAAAAAARSEIEALVLWEPCLTGGGYVREMEILASASLASLTGGEGEAEEGGGGGGEVDPVLEAGGFALSAETRDALAQLSLKELTFRSTSDVLLVTREDRPPNRKLPPHFEAMGLAVEVERLPGYKEMMAPPAKSIQPVATLQRIVDWVRDRSLEASGAVELELPSTAEHGGVERRAVRFGPDGRLFGVASERIQADGAGPGVIMLAGGVVPRTAVNRMYVTLAEELNARGRPAFRIDVSGVAEALPAPGLAWGDPYPPSLVDDALAAVDWASATWGDRPIWLLGLCSGAYAAFQVARRDDRVAGAVLINPLVFHWKEGMSLDSPALDQFISARALRGSLTRGSSWKRLLTGQIDVGRAIAVCMARARTLASTQWARLLGRVTGRERGLAGDLQQVLSAKTLALGYSEHDPGEETLRAQAGYALPRLRAMGLRLRTFPGADHTFSEMRIRRELLDWALTALDGREESGA